MASDEELVVRAREGNRQAFRLLVERHQSSISRYVAAMLGPTSEVDDVVQEVFISFFEGLDRYRGEAGVRTYLTRIATYHSLDRLRWRRSLLKYFVAREEELLTRIPDGGDEDQETCELVNAAIQELPPGMRAVVVLRMIEGYTTEETARILGIRYGTVLSRLSRALKQLRESLGPVIYRPTAAGTPDLVQEENRQ